MSKVISALNDNLQSIYRKAVDADNFLEQAQSKGQGKFAAIFKGDSPFNITSKRFLPYVQEIADDISKLNTEDKELLQTQLPEIVKKIELLLKTLLEFKQQT